MPGPCSIKKPHIEDERFKYNVTVGQKLNFYMECYDEFANKRGMGGN
jgi:hypothetical protein